MNIPDCYSIMNGDYENAKARLMNDRLIDKYLRKFLSDKTFQQLMDAVEVGDREAVFVAAHTLKGVAANMAFSELEQYSSQLTEQMRSRQQDPDPALVASIADSYRLITDTIGLLDPL